MKCIYKVLVILILFPVLSSKAQNSEQNAGSARKEIEYQSPLNGDIYVPQQTTIIIRPSKQIMQDRSESDFSFEVQGDLSGHHTGKVIISDDQQTIIFKPDQVFSLNENVSAKFTIAGTENFRPVVFSFHITSMSTQAQGLALYELHEQEQAEIEYYHNESLKNNNSEVLSTPVSISGLPSIATLDSLGDHGSHAHGNFFFTETKAFPSPISYLATINDTGVLFTQNIPRGCGNFQLLWDNTLAFFAQDSSPLGGVFFGSVHHIDSHGNLIDVFQCGNGYIADLHDFHLMNNGHAILLSYAPRVVDMTKLPGAPDTAKKNAIVFDAVIQELDKSKNVVFEWNSKDHFQFSDATRDVNIWGALVDYCHINTAEIDSTDGNMIASFRHMDEVTKINWKSGETIWRWGGKHNMFQFLGDTLQFSHQHDPARLPNGHITLWDNGNLHTQKINGKDSTVPSSRAIEYILDEVNHKATTFWQFGNVPYSAAAGNVQRLANGNTVIGFGIVGAPAAIEINTNNEVVYQLSLTKNAFVYRAYRYEFELNSVHQTGNANSFGLASIYPNPAQNLTTISFSVKDPGRMQIELLDVLGHTVRSISEKLSEAGTYTADLDVHDLAAGTYYCKLLQNGNAAMKMIVVQK